MNVLIACEFSGIVRDAFIREGYHAVSCDLLSSERPGSHWQEEVLLHLDTGPVQGSWEYDLMIAFPPCTYLAVSGARWFKGREGEQEEALEFVQMLL
ncbi:hypothetical protein LCGC14_1798580, partial [marine sediment metagenome]